MEFSDKEIVFLAPHTDDVELGCGATLAKCVEEGANVNVVVFSTASQSLPAGYASNALELEFLDAMKVYGLDSSRLTIFKYEVRKLNYHRQEILEDLVAINRRLKPDIVFTTSGSDIHQDHATVHQEALRAFKKCSIFCYELPWNQLSFTTNSFVEVSHKQLSHKVAALKCYKTQIEKNRDYFSEDFITSLARVRGVQAGSKFAEAFELICLRF